MKVNDFTVGDIVKAIKPYYKKDTIGIVAECMCETVVIYFPDSGDYVNYNPDRLKILSSRHVVQQFYM